MTQLIILFSLYDDNNALKSEGTDFIDQESGDIIKL